MKAFFKRSLDSGWRQVYLDLPLPLLSKIIFLLDVNIIILGAFCIAFLLAMGYAIAK